MLNPPRITERSIRIHRQSALLFDFVDSWPKSCDCSLVNLETTTLRDVTEHVTEKAFEWQRAICKATCACVRARLCNDKSWQSSTHTCTHWKRIPNTDWWWLRPVTHDTPIQLLCAAPIESNPSRRISHTNTDAEVHWEMHLAAIWQDFCDSANTTDIFTKE